MTKLDRASLRMVDIEMSGTYHSFPREEPLSKAPRKGAVLWKPSQVTIRLTVIHAR